MPTRRPLVPTGQTLAGRPVYGTTLCETTGDRKILRFTGEWLDTGQPGGNRPVYELAECRSNHPTDRGLLKPEDGPLAGRSPKSAACCPPCCGRDVIMWPFEVTTFPNTFYMTIVCPAIPCFERVLTLNRVPFFSVQDPLWRYGSGVDVSACYPPGNLVGWLDPSLLCDKDTYRGEAGEWSGFLIQSVFPPTTATERCIFGLPTLATRDCQTPMLVFTGTIEADPNSAGCSNAGAPYSIIFTA